MDAKATLTDEIKLRLAQRGWTQAELAAVMGRQSPEISYVLTGKRGLSAEIAVELAAALGETPHFWMQLEAKRVIGEVEAPSEEIARRARMYERVPIAEMKRRGWLPRTNDVAELGRSVCDFYGIATIDADPQLVVALRKTNPTEPPKKEHIAWAFRARQLAAAVPVGQYSEARLPALSTELRKLAAFPSEAAKVSGVMQAYGIRLVVVEPLAGGGGVDGATFWLSENEPVIALTLRFDRIDNFWHTLMHELAHVKHRDLVIDTEIVGEDRVAPISETEQRANSEAAAMLISPSDLDDFILRLDPFFSKDRINRFANRIKMHPGIIVGQLQHRGKVKPFANREMLVKIRDHFLSTAIADGWGKSVGTV